MTLGDRSQNWDESYTGSTPPWDIGRPQSAFARLAAAGALTGSLLDAGCGTGEHTILAAQSGANALGVDISPRAIDAARRKAAERDSAARFQVGDALALDGLGDTYDTIIDSGLFHVFDDPDRVRYVSALHGVLRPTGHLYLICFSDKQPGDWGPRRVAESELHGAFAAGWRFESLAPEHFEIIPVFGPTGAEAWLTDIVRLATE